MDGQTIAQRAVHMLLRSKIDLKQSYSVTLSRRVISISHQ